MWSVAKKDGEFRKSSYSGIGNCVEVAVDNVGVRMRDSKTVPGGVVLAFTASVWSEFVADTKDGHFDPPGR